jgi:hypothetical protein
MTGNIDMGGHTIEKLRLSRRVNPDRESVPNTGWVTDRFMSKVGGLVEGDIDMGDSSDIVNLRDPTNSKDAVNKQWVEGNFLRSKGHISSGGNIDLKGGSVLTLFVPGGFHVDMTGGALIGRTPQKFCRLTAIIL